MADNNAVNPGDFVNSLGTTTNIVDAVILSLTIVGAGGVMINVGKKEWQSGKGSTIRSRLVLFLVFGDLVLGIVGLIPAAATLAGHGPTDGTSFCDGIGFMLAVVLWAQHFNTLSLAVCTYLILIAPLSRWTALVERRYMWSLPLVWLCSFVMAAIAWGVQGSWAANAGLCFYKPGLFGVVYQFIPRGIVFATISILYVRLFVFLRRPDKIRSSTSLQGNSRSSVERVSVGIASTGSKIRRGTITAVRTVRGSFSFPTDRKTSAGDVRTASRISEGDEAQGSIISRRKASDPSALEMEEVKGGPRDITTGDIRQSGVAGVGRGQQESQGEVPPWERLELSFEGGTLDDAPAAEPVVGSGWTWGLKKGGAGGFGGAGEGAGSKGMGGNPVANANLTLLRPPLPPPPAQPALKRQSSFAASSEPRPDPTIVLPRRNSDLQTLHAQGWADADDDGDVARESSAAYNLNLRRGSHVSFVDSRPPSHPPSPAPAFSSSLQPTTTLASTFQYPPSPSTPGFSPISEGMPPSPFTSTFSPNYAFGRPAPGADDGSETTPSPTANLNGSPHPSFSDDKPASAYQTADTSDLKHPSSPFNLAPSSTFKDRTTDTRRSSEATGSTSTSHPLSTRRRMDDKEREDESEDQLFGHDEEDEEAQWSLEKILEMTQPPTDPGGATSWEPRERGSADVGTGSDNSPQESMAKFMNRKASLLMLSFPLAYIVLFSVSLIRIIYDFSSDTPIPALTAVSRWFVFAQGLADALIYGLIEAKVKRTVRRRTRAGHFSTSPTDSASQPHSRNNSQAVPTTLSQQDRKGSAGTKLSMPRSSR